jgi:hypothetical protein
VEVKHHSSQVLDLTDKSLPGTNLPAYFAAASATKEKRFITSIPGGSVRSQPLPEKVCGKGWLKFYPVTCFIKV